jgi:hypothetical protein
MKLLALISALVLSLSAQAEPVLNAGSPVDYYTQLETLFNKQATNLKLSDLSAGWYAGRCYYDNDKNRPDTSLMVLQLFVSPPPPNNGPLFPPAPQPEPRLVYQQLHPTVRFTLPEDKFDVLEEAEQQEVQSILDAAATKFFDLTETANGVKATGDASWTSGMNSLIKKHQEYTVIKFVTDKAEQHFGFKSAMCYYFKKVK